MNIFALDTDYKLAAKYHCDKHVVKMILETAQILSTTLAHFEQSFVPYRPTHKNHPCTIWARQSEANFEWLLNLGYYLGKEYTARYGKTHKSSAIINDIHIYYIENMLDLIEFPNWGLTPFALAMPEEYQISDDPVECYREYYRKGKSHLLQYRNNDIPKWLFIDN